MHHCDFCGKDSDKVALMIAGKKGDICNECILLCMNIIMSKTKEKFEEVNFDDYKTNNNK